MSVSQETLKPVLSVRGLSKSYGRVCALKRMDLDLYPGEILGLLGPNGSGKTTAIECMLSLRKADEGSVQIDGMNALAEPLRIRPIVGVQLQATALPDKINPTEALRLFGTFYGKKHRVGELLDLFALKEKANAAFETLSVGQKQRLVLALAWLNDPKLLVLDEPTSGLDPNARRDLLGIIQNARDKGSAILMATHQMDEAERICDRIAIMDCGCVLAVGKPQDLISSESTSRDLLVETKNPVQKEALLALPSIEFIAQKDCILELKTPDPHRAIQGLIRSLDEQQNELIHLEIKRPTLEAIYANWTGRLDANAAPSDAEGGHER